MNTVTLDRGRARVVEGREVPSVFTGLFTVILIGLVVENLVFRNIELRTVRR